MDNEEFKVYWKYKNFPISSESYDKIIDMFTQSGIKRYHTCYYEGSSNIVLEGSDDELFKLLDHMFNDTNF